MKLPFLFSCLWIFIGSEYISYDGYKTLKVHPENQEHLDILRSFSQNYHDLDFWSLPQFPGLPATIMVAPEAQMSFFKTLNDANIFHSILIDDFGSVLRAERDAQSKIQKPRSGTISFEKYHRYDEIIDYLVRLSEVYPNLVTLEPRGTTYEKRKVLPIKISTGGENKPAILIDAGIHSREWISPAAVLYLIQQLVEVESNRHMIKNVDWYIIPLLNPDGYEYTHTTDRMWRKNLSPNAGCDKNCSGTNLNRNFDFYWKPADNDSNPCTEHYPGSHPFDQQETQFLRDFVKQRSKNIKLYITVHSYGQLIMYSSAYTCAAPSHNDRLQQLSKNVANAIKNVSGTKYTFGNISHLGGPVFGTSADWMSGVAGIEASFAIELPRGGPQGFDLPPEKIVNVSTEIFEGFKVFHAYIQGQFTYD